MMRSFLKNYYGIAFEMRYRAILPYWCKWIREIIRFFQFSFFIVDFCTISQVASRPPTFLRILNNTFLLNPWMYFSRISLNVSLICLIIHSLVFWFFSRTAKHIRKGMFVPKSILVVFSIIYDFFSPLIHIQVYFRFNQHIMMLSNAFTLKNVVTFLLNIINLLAFASTDYIAAIFFRPKIFVTRSIIDTYSGCTDQYIFWLKFVLVTSQFALAHNYHVLLEIIVFSILPILIFISLERRISKGIHLSIFGAILADSPLFAFPFVLISTVHPHMILHPSIILFICIVIYAVIFSLYKIFLKKYSYMILNEKYDPPWWLPITNSLVLRYAAETEADMEQFENYMMLRMKQDPEEMIEAIRFLGIFRSQRNRLAEMMSMWKGNSAYYDYQFYVFARVFRSYEENAPQYYINALDHLHRNYLVNLTLFWQARQNKQYLLSFLYAAKASVPHSEIVSFIKYLCFIYQYDPYVHHAYSEIALVAMGEPIKAMLYRRYATALRENSRSVVDPIYRNTARFYPISLEKYADEFIKAGSDSNSKNDNSTNSSVRFHVDQNTIYRDDDTDNSILAMFVQKSKRFRPYGTIIGFIIGFMWVFSFTQEAKRNQFMMMHKVNNIKSRIRSTMNLTTQITAGILIQPILQKYQTKLQENCTKIHKEIHDFAIHYTFSFRDDYYFYSKAFAFVSDFISKASCDDLQNSTKLMIESVRSMRSNYDDFKTNVSFILYNINFIGAYQRYLVYLLIISFFGAFGIVILNFVLATNSLSNIPEHIINFLASKERLSLMLLKKSLEMCDLFKIVIESTRKNPSKPIPVTAIADKRIRVTKYASETSISDGKKSHHVNLSKDAKLTISFIGADQLLRPSQFALMSPFVNSHLASNQTSDSTEDNEDFTESFVSETQEEEYVIPEKLENVDLVSTTIDSTKKEYKNFYNVMIAIYAMPWFTLILVVCYSNIAVRYKQENSFAILDNIVQSIENLHGLPAEMYNNYTVASYKSKFAPEHLIQNISEYSRKLIPVLETADVMNSYSLTALTAWIIFAFAFWIIGSIGVYFFEMTISEGFDSLFHFPIGYLDNLEKPKDEPPEGKMPSNFLEIIITSDSRTIFSISPNCEEILGMQAIDMIGRKYDEIFPLTPGSLRERQFPLNPRKMKKFIESSFQTGRVIRVALYDTTSDNSSKTTFVNNLSKFIPSQIARKLCEERLFPFQLPRGFIIIAIFDSSEFSTSVDNIFVSTHNLLQCYTTVHLLRCEGSCMHFIGSCTDRNVPVLFIRDLITHSKPSRRGLNKDLPSSLFSICVKRSKFSAELNLGDEPFVSEIYEGSDTHVKAAFAVPQNTIFFINDCSKLLSEDEGKDIELIPGIRGSMFEFNEIDKVIDNLL